MENEDNVLATEEKKIDEINRGIGGKRDSQPIIKFEDLANPEEVKLNGQSPINMDNIDKQDAFLLNHPQDVNKIIEKLWEAPNVY